jgi:hypothetical protein
MRHAQRGAAFFAVLLAALFAGAAARAVAPAFDPNDPERSGYRLVFDAEFNDAAAIDLSGADPHPGFLFSNRLFPAWGYVSPARAFAISHGVLTIAGGQLGSAAPARNTSGYVGWAFAGGAYFEARLQFDPMRITAVPGAPITADNWWPSFYAVAAEYFTGHAQWPGRPRGYVRFAEDDFMEAWHEPSRYGATMHDWYGPKGCDGQAGGLGYCDIANDGTPRGVAPDNVAVRVPSGTDWAVFHTFGNLWVSAERAPDHRGFSQFFFDGRPTATRLDWEAGGDENTPPGGRGLFGVIDRDHMVIYIGAPAATPMRVTWVHVWQLPGGGAYPPVAPQPGFTGGNGSRAGS